MIEDLKAKQRPIRDQLIALMDSEANETEDILGRAIDRLDQLEAALELIRKECKAAHDGAVIKTIEDIVTKFMGHEALPSVIDGRASVANTETTGHEMFGYIRTLGGK